MFGRNFHLDDVVILWDAIFAQGFTSGGWMEMIELLSVAMIMYIRGDLLQKQAHQALQRLMKYVSSHHRALVCLRAHVFRFRFPPVESVITFVDRALQLKSPEFHQPAAAAASIASSVSSSVGNLASKTAAGLVSAFTPSPSPKASGSPPVASRAIATPGSKPASATRPSPAASTAAASRSEVAHAPKAVIFDAPEFSPPSDSASAAKAPSLAAVSELAQNVTAKVQRAIDVLEGSLDFDDLLKVNDALSQLQDAKTQLMEWLPKEAQVRGLPHVVHSHPVREPSHSRPSASSVEDDPLALSP
jgi:hypothetical protein